MLRAVIFDIDGTLVDSNDLHAESWVRAFREFGKEIEFAAVRPHIGKGGDQLMPVFLSKQELEKFGDELEKSKGDLYQREYMPHVEAFARVPQLFERIRRDGLKVALASSSSEEEVAKLMKLLKVKRLVDAATSADDAARTKPHPDIFCAALEKLKLQPQEALVVGDTPYDAQAAVKAGLEVVGVLCGGFPAEVLREAGCSQLFRDPEDLLSRFGEFISARLGKGRVA